MAGETNQITQIYELRSLGFKQLTGELGTINQQLKDIVTNKGAAAKNGGSVIDPAELARIKAMLDEVKTKANETRQSTGGVASAFNDLKKQFDDATQKAKDLAVQFGVNSEEARVAAVSAAAYKQELVEINNLIKNPARAPVPIVSTDNLAALEAENELLQQTGTVVTELEVAQAQAANEATAWGAANQAAAEEVAATKNAVESVITPLQEHTGSLAANIKQQATYQTRLAEISAELRANASTYDAAGKKTAEYRNKQAALLQEQKQLKIASAELGQTINAQVKYTQAAAGSVDRLSAELGILKNAYRGLNAEQRASPFGVQLVKDIQVMDVQLKKAEGAVGNFQRNVGNYASKAFGAIRTFVNIVPALGFSTFFLYAAQGIQLLFEKVSEAIGNAKEKITDFKVAQENLAKAFASSDYTKAVESFNQLRINVDLAKQGFLDKDKVIKQYNDTIGKTTGEVNDLDGAEAALVKNGPAFIRLTLLKAAANLALEEAAKKSVEAEQTRLKNLEDFASAANDIGTTFAGSVTGGGGGTAEQLAQQEKDRQDRILEGNKRRKAAAIKISEDAAKQQLSIAQKFQQDAAKIAKESGFDFFGGTEDPKTKKPKADTLGAGNTNALNIIESRRKAELDVEKKRVIDIRKTRDLSDQEEIASLNTLLSINKKYLDQKIAAVKGNNAKEREERASFNLEKSQTELDTLDKIAAINKKAFDRSLADIQNQRDAQIKAAQRTNQLVQESVNASPTEKANAKEAQDKVILDAENRFIGAYDSLEKKYNQNTAQNAKARQDNLEKAQAAEDALRKSRLATGLVDLQEIKAAGDRQQLQYAIVFAELRLKILQNDQLTASQRDAQLKKLDAARTRTILASELATANELVRKDKALLDAGLISVEQYNKAVEAALNAADKLATASTGKTLDKFKTGITGFISSLSNLFKDKEGEKTSLFDRLLFKNSKLGDESLSVGFVVQQSYGLARDAMNEYFDAQAARIQDSKQRNLDLLAQQQDIALKTAQARGASEAEQLKIQQEYQLKKDKITKEAGEKLKKQKRAEVEIAYFAELANIAAQAAANPANSITFGGAGIAQYAIMAGFATGKLLLQLAGINRQQFAFGHLFSSDDFPTKGGKIKGKSHAYGGTPFYGEAERGENHVILRTRNAPATRQYTITGGVTAIAGALNQIGGGPNFAPGARIQKYAYGGVPGSQLQPPLCFTTTSTSSNAADRQVMEELRAQNALLYGNIQALQNTVLTLQVQQVTNTVSTALRKEVNQASVATIGKRIG